MRGSIQRDRCARRARLQLAAPAQPTQRFERRVALPHTLAGGEGEEQAQQNHVVHGSLVRGGFASPLLHAVAGQLLTPARPLKLRHVKRLNARRT